MIEYRQFRNTDPPRLVGLFQDAGLGRGASRPNAVGLFELSTFAAPYFDPAGLIVAVDEKRPVGFIHAGFGFRSDLAALDPAVGIIACVVVHPDYRRQGIGRALLARAEEYLHTRGSTRIQAGESKHFDPFYFGLYGGARPSGFLQSDPLAAQFFLNLGYTAGETIQVFQRDMSNGRDPTTFRLMSIRRQTELVMADRPQNPSWWWWAHFSNVESMRFELHLKKTREPVAAVTVVGLDAYIQAWNESAIGLVDVNVPEKFRNQGYGQTLLVETIRRLRTEMITRAEIHVPSDNAVALKSVLGAGFEKVDLGVVYHKTP